MARTSWATATLSLLSLVGISQASYNCDAGSEICLTTFRWCDSSPCQFPSTVKSIRGGMDFNNAYGMLYMGDTHTINWTTPRTGDEVTVKWYIPSIDIEESSSAVSWVKNTTDNYIVFRPADVIDELATSNDNNFSTTDLIVMMADIGNHIVVTQGDPYATEGPVGLIAQSSQFSVQNGWSWIFASAQEELGAINERRRWTLGVGVGLGLGAPILVTITGLTTWWMTKRKMDSKEPAKNSS